MAGKVGGQTPLTQTSLHASIKPEPLILTAAPGAKVGVVWVRTPPTVVKNGYMSTTAPESVVVFTEIARPVQAAQATCDVQPIRSTTASTLTGLFITRTLAQSSARIQTSTRSTASPAARARG
jgi:hypothetical protein